MTPFNLLQEFVAHYPSGINPYLDDVYNKARDWLKDPTLYYDSIRIYEEGFFILLSQKFNVQVKHLAS